MWEEMLVRHCAPTLAGLKTGSLFSYPYEEKDTLTTRICRWNRKLAPKGLCVLPLHNIQKRRSLIYLYRPKLLARDLVDERSRGMLSSLGYRPEQMGQCVRHLIHRLGGAREFPHEIGLFLGYPPEDVAGFIQHKAKAYRCVGAWKVYGDQVKAQRLFAQYHQCTQALYAKWRQGWSVDRLAVSS